jgi:transmembrane sensor
METFVGASTREQGDEIERAMGWLLRRETERGNAALERDFQAWLEQSESNRRAYAAVQRTWVDLGKLPVGPSAGAEAAGNVVRLPTPAPPRSRWLAAAAAVAAACLLFLAFPALHRHLVADYSTGVAELREVVLPDGSVVDLDAGSSIAVDYRDADRRVTLLSGQAFFRVTRDTQRPFAVLAGDVSVVVTGTSFGVGKTASTVDVTVQSGSVEVLRNGKRLSDALAMGDRLVIDRAQHTVVRARMASESVAAWRSHRLVVVDGSFADIVETLGRHLPGALVVADRSLNRQAITGVFDLTQPVDALRTLAASQKATVTEVTPYLLIVSRR